MRRDEVPSVSVGQMREIDRLMADELGVTLEQMMENAGRTLAELARRALRDLPGRRITVLAGPGGNGGGVLVAARRLAIWGAEVSVARASPSAQMHPVPVHQLAIVGGMGIEVLEPKAPLPEIARSALVLDGVFGCSLSGAPRGYSAELIMAANEFHVPILALDVPSRDGRSVRANDPRIRPSRSRCRRLVCWPLALGRTSASSSSPTSRCPRSSIAGWGLAVGPLFAASDILPVVSSYVGVPAGTLAPPSFAAAAVPCAARLKPQRAVGSSGEGTRVPSR